MHTLLAGVLAALLLAGCGEHALRPRPVRLSLRIVVDCALCRPPRVTLSRGATFARVARLVPAPLPAEPARCRRSGLPFGELAIELADGRRTVYGCLPATVRPVAEALCPLLADEYARVLDRRSGASFRRRFCAAFLPK